MLGPLGQAREGLLLRLSRVGPGGLADGERRRGLAARRDVHLLGVGQLHGLVLRGLEDTWSRAGDMGAPGPAVPA